MESSLANQPKTTLVISGDVERFAMIQPNKLFLRGNAGEKLTGSVTITPEPKYPFKITGSRARIGENLSFRIDESQVDGQSKYVLSVEAVRKMPGRFFDTILLKTDSPIRSELQLTVYGQVLDPNTVIQAPAGQGPSPAGESKEANPAS